MRKCPLFLSIITLAALPVAHAVTMSPPSPLPAPIFLAQSQLNLSTPIEHSGAGSYDDFFGSGSAWEKFDLSGPTPQLSATAASSIVDANITATMYAWYVVEVVGPVLGAAIPVDVEFRLSASGLNSWGAYAYLGVNDIYEGVSAGTDHLPNVPPETISKTDITTMKTGTNYVVYMNVGAEAWGCSYLETCSAIAWGTADPYFYIDPSVPNAGDYSVYVSPGINNLPLTTSVPEPEVGSLFFAGLFVVAASIRKSRKR